MPRALFLCTTIVAAFQIHLAAASSIVEDVPASPAIITIAAHLGLDVARDRAVFLSEMTRLLYTSGDGRTMVRMDQAADTTAIRVRESIRVPVPLPAEVWGRAVFHRTIAPSELLEAIVLERRAALVAHGLTGLDDQTLTFVAEHPALLTFFYERTAASFGAFGDTFRVAGGRVIVPGGTAAVPLWEAIVHERVSTPERFARALFGDVEGRLAYLYNAIASADQPAAGFALGLWIADDDLRLERFVRLADACVRNYREWHVETRPFSRPLGDLAVLLLRLRVLPTGAPAAPAGHAFWAAVFGVNDSALDAAGSRTGAEHGLIDAAWLVDATGGVDMYSRGDRLDQFAFAQRVFGDLSEASADAVATTRAFVSHRMLLLTLERLGVRHLAVYTMAVEQATAVNAADQAGRFWTIAQYQGVLALVSRMHRRGTIGDAQAEQLVSSIARVPVDHVGYGGRMAEWIGAELMADLPAGDTSEDRIAAALAGPPAPVAAPSLLWEGQSYHIDLSYAERRRLDAIRAKQGGHTLDLALEIQQHARMLRQGPLDVESALAIAAAIRATVTANEAALRRPAINLLAPGVETPTDGYQWLTKTADDVVKLSRAPDSRRLARLSASTSELADIVLGDALVSIAYAVDLGDAEGSALLGANVALRHDFGLARRDRAARQRVPWSLPRQDFMPGVPWHITGSLLGLDIALAPLALRRVTLDDLPDAPKLPSIEREAFAVGVSLIEPGRLTDRDRDAIAESIGRGRQRVQALAAGTEPIADVATTLRLDGRRQRAAEWTREHDPAALPGQFSLAELLELGGVAPETDLNAWGTSGVYAWGCACTSFPPAFAWRILAGRAQLPYMASTLTDLNLSVVLLMRDMRLPSVLTRAVLASATRDFIDDSNPTDANDWWSLVRTAHRLRRQRVEDYVAAAAAVDGPLVPDQADVSPQP